jgi:cellulose synthase/poly-beta-1,6-N-acetylglucosamine synthase-like glycosyltransferase
MLARLLDALHDQRTDGQFCYSIVVVDNDARQTAREVVTSFARSSGILVAYGVQPEKNIALARNTALQMAAGEYVACIDDDEFPRSDWLLELLRACQHYGSDGVLGPVKPYFETPPPSWLLRGRFHERPEYPTGSLMDWRDSRTGNLLLRGSVVLGTAQVFDTKFGTGGEDKDFFFRMSKQGKRFVWCNEAAVYEEVPKERWTRAYLLRRALLRGRNTLKLHAGNSRLILKSLVAVPAYAAALPIALFMGQHTFVNLLVRLCDHLGRLLALIGLNPVRER